MRWLPTKVSNVLLTSDSGVWGEEDKDAGISILRSTNMQNDGTIDFSKLALRAIPKSKREAKVLAPGDILLENSGGGPRQPVGRVCYFEGDKRAHVAGNFCRRLRPNQKLISPRFLFWHLFYAHSRGETLRFQTQTTGIRNLQFQSYSKQPLLLPSISEQRRIVQVLDHADCLRKVSHDADAKSVRILPALFIKMFGDPATNPMGWTMSTLGQLADERPEYGANASACKPSNDKPRYIRITDITENGSLSDKDVVSLDTDAWQQYLLDTGDVLFARSGNTVGKTYIYRPTDGRCSFAGYLIRFQFRSGKVDPWFIFGLSRTSYYRAWVESHKRVAGQPNINGKEYAALRIPEPPLALQQEFASRAMSLDILISQTADAATQFDSLFKTLLQHAFSGKLTAKWREAHMRELLTEIQEQGRLLDLPIPVAMENTP